MNISNFGKQSLVDGKIQSFSKVEECKRLADEFRSKPEKTVTFDDGLTYTTIPAKQGFDVETCSFKTMKDYLLSPTKKSYSQQIFLLRIMAVRFPVDFELFRRESEEKMKKEMEIILSNATNDISFFGEVGFQNLVSYTDKSIYSKNISIMNKPNDIIKFVTKRRGL